MYIVAIYKSIYVVYNTNSSHKFLHSVLLKYFCAGENVGVFELSQQLRQQPVFAHFDWDEFFGMSCFVAACSVGIVLAAVCAGAAKCAESKLGNYDFLKFSAMT